MHTFRRALSLVPLVPLVPLALAVVPASPASADAGAAVVSLAVVYDTPVGWANCTETTSTVTGELNGALNLDGDIVRGDFDIAGTGGHWYPSPCDSALSGDSLFAVDITGTDGSGRAVLCDDVAISIVRNGPPAIGLVAGTCSLDGTGAFALSGMLQGAAVADPPGASLGQAAGTGYTFAGTFLQNLG